jgi:hypothetical protein
VAAGSERASRAGAGHVRVGVLRRKSYERGYAAGYRAGRAAGP